MLSNSVDTIVTSKFPIKPVSCLRKIKSAITMIGKKALLRTDGKALVSPFLLSFIIGCSGNLIEILR